MHMILRDSYTKMILRWSTLEMRIDKRRTTNIQQFWHIILRLLALSDNHVGLKYRRRKKNEHLSSTRIRTNFVVTFFLVLCIVRVCKLKRLPANQKIIIKKKKIYLFYFIFCPCVVCMCIVYSSFPR